MTAPIYHLTSAAEWEAQASATTYQPASLDAEGFIHCTAELPLLRQVANNFYRAQPHPFVIVEVDPGRLDAPLRWEPPAPPPPEGHPLAGQLFPHIYGPLNRSAVVGVRPAPRAADGTFLEL